MGLHCDQKFAFSLSLPTLTAWIPTTLALLQLTGCSPKLPERKPPLFQDNFDGRTELGPNWRVTAPPGVYRIEGGELVVKGAHNHPAWLTQPIPDDAVIEVDVRSLSPDGDMKVEIWGDGKSAAQSVEYTSTGYVFIHGGWHNTTTALCRMEEHGHDRKVRQDLRVLQGQKYHFMIARKGGVIRFYIDDKLVHELIDPAPLSGSEHAYFAFDNWETELHFDNLVIRPY